MHQTNGGDLLLSCKLLELANIVMCFKHANIFQDIRDVPDNLFKLMCDGLRHEERVQGEALLSIGQLIMRGHQARCVE